MSATKGYFGCVFASLFERMRNSSSFLSSAEMLFRVEVSMVSQKKPNRSWFSSWGVKIL